MAKIEKFEDIQAWQKARELTKAIYAVSKNGSFARNFGLRDQIRRAAVSVMSNRCLSVDDILDNLGIKRDTVCKWISERNMP